MFEMVGVYTMRNVFYLPRNRAVAHPEAGQSQDDYRGQDHTALHHGREEATRRCAARCRNNYFSRLGLRDSAKLAAADRPRSTTSTPSKTTSRDVVGRVLRVLSRNFCRHQGKGAWRFYTPKCRCQPDRRR